MKFDRDSAASSGQGAIQWVRHWGREGADVCVDRSSPFGNPFVMATEADREDVIAKFDTWVRKNPDFLRTARRTLAGRTLGCWCAPKSCHADVLAAIANDNTKPSADPIFVYGSNLAGKNGRGAARFAKDHRGAVDGCAEGLTGNSYAIPTKDKRIETLPVERIAPAVARFLEFARTHPELDFDVTRIGCGLAGYRDADILHLFANAPTNCRLPYLWANHLSTTKLSPRVIIAGSRTIEANGFPSAKVDYLLGQLPLRPTIVSGGARGVDSLGERYAIQRGLEFLRIPAEWDRYGRIAGRVRNQHMSSGTSPLPSVSDQYFQ